MKRLMTAAIALSLLGGSAALAQPYGHAYGHDKQQVREDRRDDRRDNRAAYQQGRQDQRQQARRWKNGERLPAAYRTRGHYVDYRRNHLRQPPRGYQWVQADNNYLMVALATGVIASIVATR